MWSCSLARSPHSCCRDDWHQARLGEVEECIYFGVSVNQTHGSRRTQEGGELWYWPRGTGPGRGGVGCLLPQWGPGPSAQFTWFWESPPQTEMAAQTDPGGYLRAWLWRAAQDFQKGEPGVRGRVSCCAILSKSSQTGGEHVLTGPLIGSGNGLYHVCLCLFALHSPLQVSSRLSCSLSYAQIATVPWHQ